MENSAYKYLKNSDYGLYNSTGQLLKGSELFEKHSGLAKHLDTKRSAFYLELSEDEVIFGCSLIVKTENGREERVVLIQVNKNLSLRSNFESNLQFLKQFYEDVKSEIETFESNKYQLIGLWNEGDFRNIKEIPIGKNALEYTAGKLHAGKKVSIKISELNSGFSLIFKLIPKLRNRSSLIFDVSQYPSESDISISLIKPNPDLEIGENGECREFAQPELCVLYKEMGKESFKAGNSTFRKNQTKSDSISLIIKKILNEPIYYCSPSNSIFDNSDDEEKIEIFEGLIQKSNTINDINIRKILINIYHKIEDPERRKDLYRILISRNLYIEELTKDLIITIYKQRSRDLFNLLFSNYSPDNFSTKCQKNENMLGWVRKSSVKNSNYDSLAKGIKDALKDLEYSEKVNYVKLIAIEASSKPKIEGRILLENLIEDLVELKGNDFILKLSDIEAKNLDEILDTNYLATKKEFKEEKRSRRIRAVFYAGLLFTILAVSCFFTYNTLSKGEENNSLSNITENNFTSGENSSFNSVIGNGALSEENSSFNIMTENDSTSRENNSLNISLDTNSTA